MQIADRYRLERRLGAGGMGEVWLATDTELGRRVALKRSHNGDAGQIRREARIGAGLQHPNIMTVFDVVNEGEHRWLVLEYLPARSLAEIIDTEGALPPDKVARIGTQLADALAAMHARNMVHRDIKPGNVLVAKDGTAKLTDLGIARWSEITMTGGGLLLGTPGYVAPEVANGHDARPASDVFSLGATLFAAVEGMSPWAGEDGPFVQLRRAAKFQLRPTSNAGPLAPVITELMRRQPEARPTAAQAKFLLTGRTNPPKHRPRRWLAAAAVLVLAAVVPPALPQPLEAAPVVDPVGDFRTADPCALLDPAWLSTFGKVEFDRDVGPFNSCELMIRTAGDPVGVSVLARIAPPIPPPPTRPGRLTVLAPNLEQLSEHWCHRTIDLPDRRVATISAGRDSPSNADLCGMAEVVSKNAVSVLSRGRLPRRTFSEGSLGMANACELVTPGDVRTAIGSDIPAVPGDGGWICNWSAMRGRSLFIGVGRHSSTAHHDRSRRLQIGSYSFHFDAQMLSFGEQCLGAISYRQLTGANQQLYVEAVGVTLFGPKETVPGKLCDDLAEVARAVADRLPKR